MRKNPEKTQSEICLQHQSKSASFAIASFAEAASAFCHSHDFAVIFSES
jgi:hypothetical protein